MYSLSLFFIYIYVCNRPRNRATFWWPDPAQTGPRIAPARPARRILYQSQARPGSVQGSTIISNLFYKKDFHTMELNDHFSNLSEHCERFIIMVIISWITSDKFNACKNSMRDKSNYLLNRNSKPYSLLLELHEDCHLFTRTS
jgi:hypothetical protein